jgi:hypothetical protein
MDMSLSKRFTEAYNEDVALLRGTIDAQDERERLAGERCGVSYSENGCDWADAVADRVIFLINRVDILQKKLASGFNADTRYRFCVCGDYIAEFGGKCHRCGADIT